MKRYNCLMIAALAALIPAASCTEELTDSPVREGNTTFSADVADFTKTELASDGKTVQWLSTDKLSVFDGTGANCQFQALSTTGTSATFTGDTQGAGEGGFYALYPYDGAASISGAVISTTLPAQQTLKSGSFADGLNIGVATIATGAKSCTFSGVTSLLKFVIPAELDDIVKVEITSAEVLAGDFTVDCSGAAPVVTKGEGSKTVTLTAGGAKIAPGTYYASVLPGDITGLTVKLVTLSGESASFSKTGEVTLNKSSVRSIGTVKWDYKALYDAGETIYICGQAYSKAANGDSKEVVATEADTKIPKDSKVFGWADMLGGVIFLSEEEGGSFATPDQRKAGTGVDVAIVGRYRGKPATIKRTDNVFLLNGGSFAFKNLILDQNGLQMISAGVDSKALLIDGCTVKAAAATQLAYLSKAVETVKVCDCDFDYAAITADNTGSLIINMASTTGTFSEFLLENNVFYSDYVVLLTAVQATSMSPGSVTLRNNSFRKVISGYNGIANLKGAGTFEATGNLFQLAVTGYSFSLVKGTVTTLNVSSQTDVKNKTHDSWLNIANGLYSTNWKILCSGGQVADNAIPRTTDDLLPNLTSISGDWTPAAKYSTYGARR